MCNTRRDWNNYSSPSHHTIFTISSMVFRKKLYDWLMNHPVFGLYIKSYIKYRGVEKRYKIFAITMLWMTIGFSVYLIEKRWVEILLVLIATGVTIHIASLKTLTREEVIELEKFEAKEKLKTEVVNNFRKSEN